MSHYPWQDNPKSATLKYLLILSTDVFSNNRDVKKEILLLLIDLLVHEENTVKLPALFHCAVIRHRGRLVLTKKQEEGELKTIQLFAYRLALASEFWPSLVLNCKKNRCMLISLLSLLYIDVEKKVETRLNHRVVARNNLLAVAQRFDYGKALWLYVHHLMNPARESVRFVLSNEFTQLLARYLFSLNKTSIIIRTFGTLYESRVVTLFQTLVTLLLNKQQSSQAVRCVHFVKEHLQIVEPYFYLLPSKWAYPSQYDLMLREIQVIS
jgi:hypothetical protein